MILKWILRPLNNGLEKNDKDNFDVGWSQLFKTVRDLWFGHVLAKHLIKMVYPSNTLSRRLSTLLSSLGIL